MTVLTKTSSRRAGLFAMAFLYGLAGMNAAWAEDSEIFFPEETDFEEEGALNPNIFFMIDTSGSMGPTSGTIDGKTRMQRLQTAFKQIMDELSPNTNVGLGRYSYFEGGAVLVPVANIETKVKDVLSEDIAISTTATAGNEAFQNIDASNSVTIVTGDPVRIGRASTTSGSNRYRTAIRFEGVNVPQGATIKAAAIEFRARASNTESLTATIQVEQADNAAALAASANNISSRSYGSNTVSWSVDSWTNGEPYATADFAALADSVVKRAGWCGGNAMLVSINFSSGSTGTRAAYSAAGSEVDLIPVLKLTVDSRDAALDTGCNVRDRAVVAQVGASTDDAEELPQDVRQEVILGNWTNWSSWTSWSRVGSRYSTNSACNNAPRPEEGVTDNAFDAFGNPTAQTDRDYQCNSRWLETRTRTRSRSSTISNVNYRAIVSGETTLDIGTPPGGAQIVGLRFPRVNAPKNAEILSAYIDFVADGADTSGASFTIRGENAANPAGFTTNTCDASPANGTPNCSYLLSVRRNNAIGTAVTWSGAAMQSWAGSGCTGGCLYSSPDIKGIVQSIVNLASWQAQNAMVFFIDGSGLRRAKAFDGTPGLAPKLRIVYRVPEADAGSSFGDMTMREYLKGVIDELPASGSTPTTGALYEAASYMMGSPVYFGRTRGMGPAYHATNDTVSYNHSFDANQTGRNSDGGPTSRISHPSTLTAASAAIAGLSTPSGCTKSNYNTSTCAREEYTGSPVYKSPIEFSCQSNSIVLLSDGEPTSNKQYPTDKELINKIGTEIGKACAENGAGKRDGACGKEIAEYLFKRDNSSLPGNQFIKTFAIAFGDPASKPYLDEIASAGGSGAAYNANSVAELVNVFRAITAAILDINTTFVSPAVTVNTFNRLTHRNELYFAVFRPDNRTKWQGNLKRYKLDANSGKIKDVNNADAVDPATGFFKESARSWWSPSADGDDVDKGGSASQLTASRNVYTYVGTDAPNNVNLTQSANAFNTTNVTTTLLGIGDKAAVDANYHANLVNWTRGIDVRDEDGDGSTTDARQSYGDPLHSEPVLITYGGTNANPDISLFFGTNEGAVHAVNANTGAEHWAFYPKELLANLDRFYTNNTTWKLRPHGMDGSFTSWVKDQNSDGQIVAADGDHAFIYTGMRRGGRNYYAFDVTDRTQPKLKFMIKGGTGSYAELGETWSKAVRARIRLGGQAREVLIFSGGHDEARDGAVMAEAAQHGRALYIADANTGQRLWWAGPEDSSANVKLSSLTYSTPASPQAIDLDGDGYVDRIYMSDVGGQIFRFILNQNNTGAENLVPSLGQTVTGTTTADKSWAQRIAKLSGDAAPNGRRFYVAPDIALIRSDIAAPFLSIAIGSGNRNHPLNKAMNDRFYVLRDPDYTTTMNSTLFIQENELYDATSNQAGSANAATAKAAVVQIYEQSKGFYVSMGLSTGGRAGEKVITEAQTFNNQVLFASYQPGGRSAARPCQASSGLSRFYLFSIIDGQPIKNLDDPSDTTKPTDPDDRFKELTQGGLPPDPALIFPDKGDGVLPQDAFIVIGAEEINLDLPIETQKTYWFKRR
ncbi:MAG TPA: hypothetical protein VGE57_08105 [Solimonas sp.]